MELLSNNSVFAVLQSLPQLELRLRYSDGANPLVCGELYCCVRPGKRFTTKKNSLCNLFNINNKRCFRYSSLW